MPVCMPVLDSHLLKMHELFFLLWYLEIFFNVFVVVLVNIFEHFRLGNLQYEFSEIDENT